MMGAISRQCYMYGCDLLILHKHAGTIICFGHYMYDLSCIDWAIYSLCMISHSDQWEWAV